MEVEGSLAGSRYFPTVVGTLDHRVVSLDHHPVLEFFEHREKSIERPANEILTNTAPCNSRRSF